MCILNIFLNCEYLKLFFANIKIFINIMKRIVNIWNLCLWELISSTSYISQYGIVSLLYRYSNWNMLIVFFSDKRYDLRKSISRLLLFFIFFPMELFFKVPSIHHLYRSLSVILFFKKCQESQDCIFPFKLLLFDFTDIHCFSRWRSMEKIPQTAPAFPNSNILYNLY